LAQAILASEGSREGPGLAHGFEQEYGPAKSMLR